MSDLIDRNAVMLRVREFIGNPTYNENMLVNDLNALPSAEPEKKGKWIEYPDCLRYEGAYNDDHIVCSECGHVFSICNNCTEEFDFCPNCGADMRGEYE